MVGEVGKCRTIGTNSQPKVDLSERKTPSISVPLVVMSYGHILEQGLPRHLRNTHKNSKHQPLNSYRWRWMFSSKQSSMPNDTNPHLYNLFYFILTLGHLTICVDNSNSTKLHLHNKFYHKKCKFLLY